MSNQVMLGHVRLEQDQFRSGQSRTYQISLVRVRAGHVIPRHDKVG